MPSWHTGFKNYADQGTKRENTTEARVRATVEHPFRILMRILGFTKVRYRGLRTNHQWLCAAFISTPQPASVARCVVSGEANAGPLLTAKQTRKTRISGDFT